eukprot:gene8231-5753_t
MRAFYIGRREYMPVLRLQEIIFEAKIRRQTQVRRGEVQLPLLPDVNILVEHASPVYTVGRRNTSEGLPPPGTSTVPVVRIKRGGGITYHGPGQVTMYPIANLQRLWKACAAAKPRSPIEWFSEVLEKAMMDTAAAYAIPCHPFKTGVWADAYNEQVARKIGSIGLQMGSNWISMHGAGFNVSTDNAYFGAIIMCELPGRSATSVVEEMKCRGIAATRVPSTDITAVAPRLHRHFVQRLHHPEGDSFQHVTDLSGEGKWMEIVCDAVGVPVPQDVGDVLTPNQSHRSNHLGGRTEGSRLYRCVVASGRVGWGTTPRRRNGIKGNGDLELWPSAP